MNLLILEVSTRRSSSAIYYYYIADEDLRVEMSRISKFMLLTLNKTLFSNICIYVYSFRQSGYVPEQTAW